MSNTLNITVKEFDAWGRENDGISDIDYSYNPETKEYDIPSVEWDGPYGRHWVRYESQEAMEKALNRHELQRNQWILEYRTRSIQEAIDKGRKMREISKQKREAKTLGGQFPVLKQLLEQSR